jgi:hypothetical protein
VVISVYKQAPPEVLDELNKGELPDEVRGQHRAIEQERARQAAQAELKHKRTVEQHVHSHRGNNRTNGEEEEEEDDDLEVLNTKKRDRRTAEDFARERGRR